MNNDTEWNVECSDEESYFEADKLYRTPAEGERIWEPCGEDIVHLYEEIHIKGYNQLDWECPGKISPSQLDHLAEERLENNCSGLEGGTQAKSQFDFDNDFEDSTFGGTAARVTKRSQVVVKKSQTNLTKVMQDIKKYQMIDNINNNKIKPSVNSSDISTRSSSSQPEGDQSLNKSISEQTTI